MDYRDRCYKVYISKHWKRLRGFSQPENDFIAKSHYSGYRKFLPPDKKSSILEIACGPGSFLYFLEKEGYTNVRGIDSSGEQLEMAMKSGVSKVEEADFFDYLPKYPAMFDMVIAINIIEHLRKDEALAFLDLVFSSLRPGGAVLISTNNAASLLAPIIRYDDFTHEVAFTPLSLLQVLEVCGFDAEVYPLRPVCHNLASSVRAILWRLMEKILASYLIIEQGFGRGRHESRTFFTPLMVGIGRKAE